MNFSKKNHSLSRSFGKHHKINLDFVSKKLITFTLLLLLLVACKEDTKNSSSTKENEVTNEAFLTAKVDGVAYSFSDKVKLGSTKELSHVINGSNKKLAKRITLGLNLDKQETGIFGLDNNTVLVYHANIMFHEKEMGYNWNAKESLPSTSGKITITKNNATYLEGTFIFDGVGATKVDESIKKVTDGNFRVLKK